MLIAVFAEATPAGRIVSVRTEMASIEDIVTASEYAPHVHALQTSDESRTENDGDDATSVVPFLAIERMVTGSASAHVTVTRVYSLHEAIVEMLLAQNPDDDPSLGEDAELVRFAISANSGEGGVDPYQMYYQKVRPIEIENALLRAALGFKKRDNVDLTTVKRKLATISATRAGSEASFASQRSSSGSSKRVEDGMVFDCATQTEPQQLSSVNGSAMGANTVASTTSNHNNATDRSPTDPFAIHAPHLWEMETDAAVNARTKYKPYRSYSPPSRKLDIVTQQHLVVRLHDKSVDTMRLRRNGQLKELDASERRCLTADEQMELGSRLHDRQREHSKKLLEELDSKFNRTISPSRVLSPDELRTSTERVYREPMERKRNNLEKLIQRYVYDEEDKQSKMKLTVDQQKAVADRLSSKK